VSLTAVERETSTLFDDENDYAITTTYNRAWITSLKDNPGVTIIEEGKCVGSPYVIAKYPKSLLPKPRRPRAKRNLTAEQKAELVQRGRNLAAHGRKGNGK
jgi:hypothetical protein